MSTEDGCLDVARFHLIHQVGFGRDLARVDGAASVVLLLPFSVLRIKSRSNHPALFPVPVAAVRSAVGGKAVPEHGTGSPPGSVEPLEGGNRSRATVVQEALMLVH